MNRYIMCYRKSLTLNYISCNKNFLHYTGLKTVEQVTGLKDSDLCWAEYEKLYNQYEFDTLTGKQFSSIAPIKNYKNEELWFIGNKYVIYGENQQIIGTESVVMEILEPKLLEFSQFFQKNGLHKGKVAQGYSVGRNNKYALSSREEQCLFYILQAKSAKETAKILNLTPRTIESYIEKIKYKLNCKNKSELILKATQEGLRNHIPSSIISNMRMDTLR